MQVTVNPNTDVAPGTYRNINGTEATALGLLAASVKSGLPLVFGAYPITPASDLLHSLSRHASDGVRTIQAEDEIAAASIALGAAFGGCLGVTCTSGPGLDLKTETIGLAVTLELPMVIIDVQRAGPSTGMPTKTEQSDLLQALHGRHGESPLPVVAAQSPGQCFDAVYRGGPDRGHLPHAGDPAQRPVPGQLERAVADPERERPAPDRPALPHRDRQRHAVPPVRARRQPGPPVGDPRHQGPAAPDRRPGEARRHRRDLLRRPQPPAHDRAARSQGEGVEVPDLAIDDNVDADLLVLGWGSSYGTIRAGARRVQERGGRVATAHLRHLHPMPANLGEVLRSYERVLVPEMNSGQLAHELRARYLVDVETYAKVQGQPLLPSEMEQEIWQRLS